VGAGAEIMSQAPTSRPAFAGARKWVHRPSSTALRAR
jgi:hypothetical protein